MKQDSAIDLAHILLVDDEPDIAMIMKRGLTKAGFDVTSFTDPLQALANFRQGVYDFLLLDVKMPQMDGLTLYDRIYQIDNKPKACFLTGFDALHDPDFAKKSIHHDSKCFLQKPVSMKDLVLTVKSKLGVN
ncbi:MAG: response regulator [Nitrososphaera sp.]|jgi:DNA-binding response OmpR family regulator